MEEGNYRGRIKRLEKWIEIQTVVVQKLSKLVVICMLDVARERIFRKVEFPDRIPCSMYWVDSVMLFLVFVLDYDSQNVLEKKYKVPHATAGRVITWMIKKLKLINTIFTKCLTYNEQRLKVTEDYISTCEMMESMPESPFRSMVLVDFGSTTQ